MAALAHNLSVRRAACQHSFPGVLVGWIGDAKHQRRHSDHNPDSRDIVHAIDIMVRQERAKAVVAWALAHPADLEYVIYNRTIWTRAHGFQPRKYTGTDPHTEHVHISGRHGSVGADASTGNGYDVASESMTPVGTPTDPGRASMVPKQAPAPAPTGDHRPGSRELKLLSPPMSGADVRYVQRFIGQRKCGPPTGVYNEQTASGVRWYQDMRGIDVDGRVGHDTWSNMRVANNL